MLQTQCKHFKKSRYSIVSHLLIELHQRLVFHNRSQTLSFLQHELKFFHGLKWPLWTPKLPLITSSSNHGTFWRFNVGKWTPKYERVDRDIFLRQWEHLGLRNSFKVSIVNKVHQKLWQREKRTLTYIYNIYKNQPYEHPKKKESE